MNTKISEERLSGISIPENRCDIYSDGSYLENNPSWHAEDSDWKAEQIFRMIMRNDLHLTKVAEVGFGAGGVIDKLSRLVEKDGVSYSGYEVSPQAFDLAKSKVSGHINLYLENILSETNRDYFDLLLIIDVLEHIPDYMSFARDCKRKASYKIYHIPLEVSVSSVLRNTVEQGRYSVGHLHYFTAASAIATLEDTGHEILDYFYTDWAFGLFRQQLRFKRTIVNFPRWLLARISVPATARLLGGYSLLALTR